MNFLKIDPYFNRKVKIFLRVVEENYLNYIIQAILELKVTNVMIKRTILLVKLVVNDRVNEALAMENVLNIENV